MITLHKIAQVCGTGLADLFGETGKPVPDPLAPWERAFAKAFGGLHRAGVPREAAVAGAVAAADAAEPYGSPRTVP